MNKILSTITLAVLLFSSTITAVKADDFASINSLGDSVFTSGPATTVGILLTVLLKADEQARMLKSFEESEMNGAMTAELKSLINDAITRAEAAGEELSTEEVLQAIELSQLQ